MPIDDDLEHFSRLVEALRPFLDKLVIVGGWAHRLYRFRADARVPAYSPLFTNDADIAISSNTSLPSNLRKQLLANGFVEEFMGDERPPVTHYCLGDEASGFYVEFLTPMFGGGGRRERPAKHTAQIAGVVAQRLRHLDILLIEPWSITLDRRIENAPSQSVTVRVPNAVCYIAQKLLIHAKRKPIDRPKDVLYIHDTVELFGSSLGELRSLWQERVRPNLSGATAARVKKLASELFREVTDTVRDAAVAAADRQLSAEAIRLLCEVGLREIFESTRQDA
jgi:Nucleotidyltransferase